MKTLNGEKVNKILENSGKQLLEGGVGKVKLHLGCGYENWEDYINIDLNAEVSNPDIINDATDLSSFPDESLDEIVTYHMIEHLGHRKVPQFFRDCYKKLKPGCSLIFECPNLAAALEKFCSIRANSGEILGDFGDNSVYETIYGGQKDAGSFHLACYTRYQLLCMLKWAGFEDLKIVSGVPIKGKEYGPDWNIRMVCTK